MQPYEADAAAVSYLSYERIHGWIEKKVLSRNPPLIEVFFKGEKIGEVEGKGVIRPDGSPGNRITFDFQRPARIQWTHKDFPHISVRLAESGRPLHGSPADSPAADSLDFDTLGLFVSQETNDQPPLDRSDLDEKGLTERQRSWRRDGSLILPAFLPETLIKAYVAERRALDPGPYGWACPVAYMHVPSLRSLALYPPLMEVLEELFGVPMGLNLNLTGWISTERNWHQDDYLNPPAVNSWYVAVWMALDEIHPDSGPFQYVPGSHSWPRLDQAKVIESLPYHERIRVDWPATSERFVVPACERMIAERGGRVETFLAKRGDLLIWHALLMHRGSPPKREGMERRSLICHYSAIDRRPDFPAPVRHEGGGWYFPSDLPL